MREKQKIKSRYTRRKMNILYLCFHLFVLYAYHVTECTRHVCGGSSQLEVIEELFVNNPYTENEEQLGHVIHTISRKAAWVQKHTTKLMTKYRRSGRSYQMIVSTSAPGCLNFMNTDILENSIWEQTSDRLREQYNVIMEVISVLSAMEQNEANSADNIFSAYLRGVRVASEQLLCEIYVGIGVTGGLMPGREIPGSVPLCMYTERIERYARDYYLLHRIKDISQMMLRQYLSNNL